MFFPLLILMAIFAATPLALAQQTSIAISGTVTDSTGAVVPNAQVVVQNVQTGIKRSTETNGQGQYSVPNLDIGEYQIQVEARGFEILVLKGISLSVGNSR